MTSRALLVWADLVNVAAPGQPDDWRPAGIQGDQRLKNGAVSTGTPSNEYQGNFCGVGATIGVDLNFTPDVLYTPSMQSICGPARFYNFFFAGPGGAPIASAPHSIARGLGNLALGQSVLQFEGFGVGLPGCTRIMFDSAYPPASSPRQTRLNDVVIGGVTVRQWRIESQGTHQGVCQTYNNNGSVKTNGPWYFMPFALTVTEVKYPYPVYP